MNQAEATIIGLQIRAQGIQANITSMLAHDMQATANGTGPYTEQTYLNKADEMFEIGTEILRLSALLEPITKEDAEPQPVLRVIPTAQGVFPVWFDGAWRKSVYKYGTDYGTGIALYAAPIPQQPEPSVPEGWKLVPIEPTEAMLEVGFFAENDVFDSAKTKRIHVWKDMIAAAPQPKETK